MEPMQRPHYNQHYIHVGSTGYQTQLVRGSGHAHKINHDSHSNCCFPYPNRMRFQYNMGSCHERPKLYKPGMC